MPNVNNSSDKIISGLKKEFVLVGKSHIHGWYAWAILGICVGMFFGILYVSNWSGRFDAGRASETGDNEQVMAIKADPSELKIISPQDSYEWNASNETPFPLFEIASFENGEPSAGGLAFSYSRTGANDFRSLVGTWNSAEIPGHSLFIPLGLMQLSNGRYDIRVTRLSLPSENNKEEFKKELPPVNQEQTTPDYQSAPREQDLQNEQIMIAPQANALAQVSKWFFPPLFSPIKAPIVPPSQLIPGQTGGIIPQTSGYQAPPQYSQYPGLSQPIYAETTITIQSTPWLQSFSDDKASTDETAGGAALGSGAAIAPPAGSPPQLRSPLAQQRSDRQHLPWPIIGPLHGNSSESCDPSKILYLIDDTPVSPSGGTHTIQKKFEGEVIKKYGFPFKVQAFLDPNKKNISNCLVRQYVKRTTISNGEIDYYGFSDGVMSGGITQKLIDFSKGMIGLVEYFPAEGYRYADDINVDGKAYSAPLPWRQDDAGKGKIEWADTPGGDDRPIGPTLHRVNDFVEMVIGFSCEPGWCGENGTQHTKFSNPAVAIKSHLVQDLDGEGNYTATMTYSPMERIDKGMLGFCQFVDKDFRWVGRDVLKHGNTGIGWGANDDCLNPGEEIRYTQTKDGKTYWSEPRLYRDGVEVLLK